MRAHSTLTFVHPTDAAAWCVGDTVRTEGKRYVVVYVGHITVGLAPASWWRCAWFSATRGARSLHDFVKALFAALRQLRPHTHRRG